jgi:FkbM family methyltransferase
MKRATTIGSLFVDPKGVRFVDKIALLFLRFSYYGVRLSLRFVVGKKVRDRLFVRYGLDFPTFAYRLLKTIGLEKVLVLLLHMPKQGYKFFCRINRDEILFMTNHENDILEYFIPDEGDTVVDVGAHIGLYTIIAAKRVGPTGKVIAIEPDPENFKILKKNILLNQLSNVEYLECAAYSTKKKLKLFLPEVERGRTIFNTVMEDRVKSYDDFIEVESNTLDNILNEKNVQRVNYVKIDVEGAELEVLKGAVNTLSSNKDLTLLIEVHGEANYMPLLRIFKEHKFQIDYEQKYPSNDRHIIAKKIPHGL